MQPATVTSIRQESPTVRSFTLDLGGQDFQFLPGQWVDCYVEINGELEIAGYSMTSSPLSRGSIDLAVKRVGTNQVTNYLHSTVGVGDIVSVNGGQGGFYFTRGMADSLTLIAGGIGITPLMSILRYVDEVAPNTPIAIVHSASEPAELIFRNAIETIGAHNGCLRYVPVVSGHTSDQWDGHIGRISSEILQGVPIDYESHFYVCGPPNMINHTIGLLLKLGIPSSQLKFERW
ncbi:FAD-binding oxidoreductase [Dehalococcoidia bacterium]|nr:FAD-binding oxidoreductase [Dehalococcoidia bacterium]